MTEEEPRANGVGSASLLKEARAHYRTMLWLFQARLDVLRDETAPLDVETRKLVSSYAQAVAMLLAEIRKVDQEDAKNRADRGGAVFDLDALRAEVGGRLARLRAAGTAGSVSEQPE